MTPIFETKILFEKVALFPSFLSYKTGLLGKETTIPLDQIASIEAGMAGVQQIVIETTGGRKVKMAVRLKDKENLINAIYTAKKK